MKRNRETDSSRRRPMIQGTIARTGELIMRHGQPSQFATLDCTSSRRSTVMRALLRATVVTTEYQRDSSKRPRIVGRLCGLSINRSQHVGLRISGDNDGVQGFAPCGRRLRRPWTPPPSSDENALS